MSRQAKRSGSWAAAAALALALASTAAADEPPVATGTGGAAASVDARATQAAIDQLERGRNAVDAAVAAAGVLGVTEPFSAGIGGGGFMLIRTPGGKVTTIDGRETAPDAMRPRSFFEDGEPLPFADARYSGLSAGVPGTVATWERALRKYGTISMGKALRPGAKTAVEGFAIDQTFFDQVEANVPYFDDVPATARIYLDNDGTPRDVGTTLRNPDMARAYQRIMDRGAKKGFYGGKLAKAMVRAARNPRLAGDADHEFRPGLIKERDLKVYEAPERKPTRIGYRGLRVYGMGPPSSGGSTVGEILNILEGYEPLGASRAEALHRFLEASRYSYADRGAYLADPAYFDVPLDGLLSDEFAAERRALITDQAADAGPVEPGDPEGNARASAVTTDNEGASTTHLSVADSQGTVVSYTFTIESTGGNGIVVPRWGFLLNNELTDFSYDNPKAANKAEGGKRPRSSMAPTLVTDGGEPVLAVGSPGGSTIITTVAQVLIERFDLGKTLPEAIATPRLTQRNTTTTLAEPEFLTTPEATALETQYGHALAEISPPEIGAVAAIEFLGGGAFLAAAEPERRGGGSAAVVDPG